MFFSALSSKIIGGIGFEGGSLSLSISWSMDVFEGDLDDNIPPVVVSEFFDSVSSSVLSSVSSL